MEDLQTTLRALPQTPGVYLYRDKYRKVIYVGKATNLAKRIRQYFQKQREISLKQELLVENIHAIETVQTISEFDAILLEAKLIKYYHPKYNSVAKDDKSPLYILISFAEELPRITFVRKPKSVKASRKKLYFGPFQSAKIARSLMREIRQIVPYCTQKQRTGKPCFYTHLGLCSPCPAYIVKLEPGDKKNSLTLQYRKNIFRIRDILSGAAKSIVAEMEKEMNQLARNNEFEKAVSVREHLRALYLLLERKYDPLLYIQNETFKAALLKEEQMMLLSTLREFYPNLSSLKLIECIDISNIQGKQATGSLVVFENGEKDSDKYRKFKIRLQKAPNDVAMMAEVLERRLNHSEWKYPNLLIVDGGKGQLQHAQDVLVKHQVQIPIIGLAKRREEIIVKNKDLFVSISLPLTSPALHLLQRIRDEAHRFAVTYHRLLRSKQLV